MADAVVANKVYRFSRSAGDFDLMEPDSIAALAARCPDDLDFVFDATGALEIGGVAPEKAFAELDPANMARHFAVNSIGPALILRHFMGRIARQRPAVLATLSARVGSIGDNGLGGWISYRASKAALNQIVRTASIELRRKNREALCVALHPGTVETDLTRKYAGAYPMVPAEEAAQNLLGVIGRLGPEDTGGFFDWKGDTVRW